MTYPKRWNHGSLGSDQTPCLPAPNAGRGCHRASIPHASISPVDDVVELCCTACRCWPGSRPTGCGRRYLSATLEALNRDDVRSCSDAHTGGDFWRSGTIR